MELVKILQSGFALIFVLSIIGIASVLIRKAGANKISGFKFAPKRIKITEVQPLDQRSKLIIAEKDNKEYFILKTDNSASLLEVNDIKKTDEVKQI